ncbi:MAG: S-layer homology domain-containing protein [Peptostreptococcaceae bacterium]
MNRKMSIAMASTMVVSSVVPAFATQVTVENITEVDVRLANAQEIFEDANGKSVFTRYEVFNYNGASASDKEKHTLKSQFANLEVLVQEEGEDANNDLIVLATAQEDTIAVSREKANYDLALAEIDLLLGSGYEVTTRATTNATITKDAYTASQTTITLAKDGRERTFNFNNVDTLEIAASGDALTLRSEVFGKVIKLAGDKYVDGFLTVDFSDADCYKVANLTKYILENTDKFDFVIDESNINNVGVIVKLYIKDAEKTAENLVLTIDFTDLSQLDKDSIIDMPSVEESDFSHIGWAKDQIIEAMLAGIIDASSSFRPHDSMTRAEFSKVVANSFGIKVNSTNSEPFHDVEDDAWYRDYVAALYSAGIVSGYDAQTFGPQGLITREEAAKMITLAYAKNDGILPLVESLESEDGTNLVSNEKLMLTSDVTIMNIHVDSKTKFADDSEISTWADGAVANLVKLGVSNGYEDNTFRPQNSITRAEVMVMLSRISN